MALGYYTTGSSSSSSRTSGSGRVGGAPGREWKKHRYIRKEGNKYIYPEDLQKNTQQRSQSVQATRQQAQQKLARSNAAAANEKYKNRDHDDRVRYAKQEAQRAFKEAQKLNNSPMNKLDDAMKGVGKFFDDTGKSISKGVDDAGKAISKGVNDVGKGIEKGMRSADQYLRKNVTEKAEKFWNDPTGESARDRRKAILAEAAAASANKRAKDAENGPNADKRSTQAAVANNRALRARSRVDDDYSLPTLARAAAMDMVDTAGKGIEKGMKSADKYLRKNVTRKGEKFINDLFGRTPKGQLSKSEKLLRSGEAAARNKRTAENTLKKDISTKSDKEFYNQKAVWNNAWDRDAKLNKTFSKYGKMNQKTANDAAEQRRKREENRSWAGKERRINEHIIKEEKIFDPIGETHRRAKNNRYTYKRSVDQKIEKNRRKKSK